MLLSYKHVHLQAQERLQEEGCVVDIIGQAVLTSWHVLNKVPTKDNETTPYEQWEKKRTTLSYLCTWGCLAKVNVLIPKKRKLGPKTMDCVNLGYAKNSVGYRFLVVKSEVPYRRSAQL